MCVKVKMLNIWYFSTVNKCCEELAIPSSSGWVGSYQDEVGSSFKAAPLRTRIEKSCAALKQGGTRQSAPLQVKKRKISPQSVRLC